MQERLEEEKFQLNKELENLKLLREKKNDLEANRRRNIYNEQLSNI